MITDELKAMVSDEAAKLKQHATAGELCKLDFDSLIPQEQTLCIYGQMTGNCYSARAGELIQQCAKSYSSILQRLEHTEHAPAIMSTGKAIWRKAESAFTAIEFYIYQPGSKNAELIAYLRGETDNLEL